MHKSWILGLGLGLERTRERREDGVTNWFRVMKINPTPAAYISMKTYYNMTIVPSTNKIITYDYSNTPP